MTSEHPRLPGAPSSAGLTSEQIEEFAAAWRAAVAGPHAELKLLTPLPWRVRARLRASQWRDHVAVWLAEHRMLWAAEALWFPGRFLVGRRGWLWSPLWWFGTVALASGEAVIWLTGTEAWAQRLVFAALPAASWFLYYVRWRR